MHLGCQTEPVVGREVEKDTPKFLGQHANQKHMTQNDPLHPGCLIGILIVVHDNPHITG